MVLESKVKVEQIELLIVWLVKPVSLTYVDAGSSYIYPTKKETHHYDFPIKISFKYENFNSHKIFISDKILIKLKCDVDEYLYLHCVGTKHINAMGKGVLEALIQRYCLHEIPSMFYISKV